MKQLGDEMKLPETCTFSLKFQTVETQESLITVYVQTNPLLSLPTNFENFLAVARQERNKKRRKINVYCYSIKP